MVPSFLCTNIIHWFCKGFLHSRIQHVRGVQRRIGKRCSVHVWVCKDTDVSNSLTDARNGKIVILSARLLSKVNWSILGQLCMKELVVSWFGLFLAWAYRADTIYVLDSLFFIPPIWPHVLRLTSEKQLSPWGTLTQSLEGESITASLHQPQDELFWASHWRSFLFRRSEQENIYLYQSEKHVDRYRYCDYSNDNGNAIIFEAFIHTVHKVVGFIKQTANVS